MTYSSRPRTFIALSFVFALGVVGCGSSSSNGAGGTNGSKGGSSGSLGGKVGSQGGSTGTTGTGGTIGGGGASGACAKVSSCYSNLVASCGPAGTCVVQKVSDTSFNTCYSNGVIEVDSFTTDATGTNGTSMTTVSKSGTTCFTESTTGSLTGGGTTMFVWKNAAGATIITITLDEATGTETATCNGQSYDTTGTDHCAMPGTTAPSACTDGTCP